MNKVTYEITVCVGDDEVATFSDYDVWTAAKQAEQFVEHKQAQAELMAENALE